MDIQQIRIERLRQTMRGYESAAAFARKHDLDSSYISQLLNGHRGFGEKAARKIEIAVGLGAYDLDRPMERETGTNVVPLRDTRARQVPVISYIQAGDPKTIEDPYAIGGGMNAVNVDGWLANDLGPSAFALEVKGRSMEKPGGEGMHEGDIVIVDPEVPPRPGDIVVAQVNGDTEATLKKYRARGNDSEGEVFELIPLNDDYAPILCDAENPGRIVGPVVEHRRRYRRKQK